MLVHSVTWPLDFFSSPHLETDMLPHMESSHLLETSIIDTDSSSSEMINSDITLSHHDLVTLHYFYTLLQIRCLFVRISDSQVNLLSPSLSVSYRFHFPTQVSPLPLLKYC